MSTEAIRKLLADRTEDTAMTAAEIVAACDEIEDSKVAGPFLHGMVKSGELERKPNEAGKYVYWPTGNARPRRGRKPASLANDKPARQPASKAPKADGAATTDRPLTYRLYDHISAAAKDLEDLQSDAIDHTAPPAVLKAIAAAGGALRRAQEALVAAARP